MRVRKSWVFGGTFTHLLRVSVIWCSSSSSARWRREASVWVGEVGSRARRLRFKGFRVGIGFRPFSFNPVLKRFGANALSLSFKDPNCVPRACHVIKRQRMYLILYFIYVFICTYKSWITYLNGLGLFILCRSKC